MAVTLTGLHWLSNPKNNTNIVKQYWEAHSPITQDDSSLPSRADCWSPATNTWDAFVLASPHQWKNALEKKLTGDSLLVSLLWFWQKKTSQDGGEERQEEFRRRQRWMVNPNWVYLKWRKQSQMFRRFPSFKGNGPLNKTKFQAPVKLRSWSPVLLSVKGIVRPKLSLPGRILWAFLKDYEQNLQLWKVCPRYLWKEGSPFFV